MVQSWLFDVHDLKKINSHTVRLCDDKVSVDIPTRFSEYKNGDRVKLEIDPQNAGCIMQGHVYMQTEASTFVSCGGLLCKFPNFCSYKQGDAVKLGISQSRRRTRKSSA